MKTLSRIFILLLIASTTFSCSYISKKMHTAEPEKTHKQKVIERYSNPFKERLYYTWYNNDWYQKPYYKITQTLDEQGKRIGCTHYSYTYADSTGNAVAKYVYKMIMTDFLLLSLNTNGIRRKMIG